MLKKFRRLFRKPKQPPVMERSAELRGAFPDFDESTLAIIEKVEPFTMTSPERIESLCQSVRHIVRQQIEGDIVECGVWRGGSMMATAWTLLQENDSQRNLHLFDTFEGMPPAAEIDRDFQDHAASEQLDQQDRSDPQSIWCYSGISEVKRNMSSTGYPTERLKYIQGQVEETLSANLPESIALLRLDTDWYESTRVCLEELYPRLVPGGILIVDDYGHWQGCKKAVDEYMQINRIPLFLQRIDYTGRIALKPASGELDDQRKSA